MPKGCVRPVDVHINGEVLSFSTAKAACEHFSCDPKKFRNGIRRGLTVEQAIGVEPVVLRCEECGKSFHQKHARKRCCSLKCTQARSHRNWYSKPGKKEKKKVYKKDWEKSRPEQTRERKRLVMKKRRDEKPEETLAYQRAYREKHKDKVKAQRRVQQRKYYAANKTAIYQRKRSDPLSRIVHAVRALTVSAYKRREFKKNTKTFTLLQCSPEQFIAHIESQFTEGMTPENFGAGGWDIDHVIPVAAALTEEHVSILSHYLNLQPLWRVDNKEKSETIVPSMVIPVLKKLIPIFGKEPFAEMLRGSAVDGEV
jgi:hypothetical protein